MGNQGVEWDGDQGGKLVTPQGREGRGPGQGQGQGWRKGLWPGSESKAKSRESEVSAPALTLSDLSQGTAMNTAC